MKKVPLAVGGLGLVLLMSGCESVPPGTVRGPHNTIPYDVTIDASAPGARIEANGEDIGPSPVHITIYGDKDGTFHDFGSYNYVIRALPTTTNQYAQIRVFQTGHMLTPEDRIPQRIYFDMNYQPPAYAPSGPPIYVYPGYGPPVYCGPPYYYGPEFRFHFGAGPGYRRHW